MKDTCPKPCLHESSNPGSIHLNHCVNGALYSETSDKGHSERGQTSQHRANQKYTLYRKSPLKEDLKTAGPEGVLIKRLHYSASTLFFTSEEGQPL